MKKSHLAVAIAAALSLGSAVPAVAATQSADPNPPTVAAAAIDKTTATVGDTLNISYDIIDPDGVSSVGLGITQTDPSIVPDPSYGGSASSMMGTSGDSTTGWSIDVTSRTEAGRRWVYALRVTDKAGYTTTIYDATYAKSHGIDGQTADLSALTWEVLEPGEDPNPPKLVSASVDKSSASVGDTVTISYDIADSDGVSSVSLRITEEDPSIVPDEWGPQVSYPWYSSRQSSSSMAYRITSETEPGRRWVDAIEVADKSGWVTTIYDETYAKSHGIDGQTADLSALTWEVLEHGDDPNPSKLGSSSIDKPVATVGDKVTISYDIIDPDGVSSVELGVTYKSPSIVPDPSQGVDAGLWIATRNGATSSSTSLNITSETETGRRWIWAIRVTDESGWVTTIYDETYAKSHGIDGQTADLSALTWEVVEPSTLPTYDVLDGEGSKYEKGGADGLEVRFDGKADDLASVQVDGETIAAENYTVTSGSTVITLKPAYLDALDEGDHTVTSYYKDGGRATASFTVAAQQKEEEKDDKSDQKDDQKDDSKSDQKDDQKGNQQQGNQADKDTKPNSQNDADKKTADQKAADSKKASLPATGDALSPMVITLAVAGASVTLYAVRRQTRE